MNEAYLHILCIASCVKHLAYGGLEHFQIDHKMLNLCVIIH